MHQPSLELLNKKFIILADETSERQALLKNVGLRVTLCNTTAKKKLKHEDFWSISEYLETSALEKANEIIELFNIYGNSPDIVIGCDTCVTIDGAFFKIPQIEENRYKILREVSGKSYFVNAGVVIKMEDKVIEFTENTKVDIKELSDNDIRVYTEIYNKYTNYGLLGIGGSIVDKIEGDFFTVIGLPLLRLGKELEKLVS